MFRNKEIQKFTVVFTFITMTAVVAGFLLQPAAGMLVFVFAALYGAAFFTFTGIRYRRIAEISARIDEVLHHEDCLYIGESEEGELSILESEIVKMTLRIREQNEALKREKKYLADSLADIAHQLRTPLTSANLILSLLKDNPKENKRKALQREMKGLFGQMDWLITALLKLSRLDAGIVVFQSRRTEVKTVIDAALRSFLIPMELHNVTLEKNVPEGVAIQGDGEWLSESIQNLLKNCMESAGDNGKIEIICTDTLLFTEITIRDNGPGFTTEELPHLFDRFYRGKNSNASGYGIGLALCRTIIARQGGTITARNHPQGGALFTIRFPKLPCTEPLHHI